MTTGEGVNFENLWQFSKVYQTVPAVKQTYSRYDNRIIWAHPAETHVDAKGEILPAYWKWRSKGFAAENAIRYPVGYGHRHTCLYALWEEEKLDYIQARKKIYVRIYCQLVKLLPMFAELKKRLDAGEKLLIAEVDGPHAESIDHYIESYGVDETFIDKDSMLGTEHNLTIMLNDSKHPFGHGYCLAMALLDLEDLIKL